MRGMPDDVLSFEKPDLELAAAAVIDATGADVAYCKFLTPNDTGETASHQAGFHVAKGAWPVILDHEGMKGQNTDKDWRICWNGQHITDSRAIYYGQGTRNEYRLTRFGTDFPYRHPENTGDLWVLTRRAGSSQLNAWVLSSEAAVDEFLGAFALSPENTNQLLDQRRGRSATVPDQADREARLISEYVAGLPEGLFPTTYEISRSARAIDAQVHRDAAPGLGPDSVIKRWAELEYRIFLAVEERTYGDLVAEGFETVDEFVDVANRVLNRRKSRAGHSLENHLAAIFDDAGVGYEAQVRTEGNRKPDFIFPSAQRYHDRDWPDSRLVFLAAKTTCKDRWRQILNEAARIPHKHLFTLQQGITSAQLDEMSEAGVTLVVPADNKKTYPPEHRDWILSLAEFIALVREVTV